MAAPGAPLNGERGRPARRGGRRLALDAEARAALLRRWSRAAGVARWVAPECAERIEPERRPWVSFLLACSNLAVVVSISTGSTLGFSLSLPFNGGVGARRRPIGPRSPPLVQSSPIALSDARTLFGLGTPARALLTLFSLPRVSLACPSGYSYALESALAPEPAAHTTGHTHHTRPTRRLTQTNSSHASSTALSSDSIASTIARRRRSSSVAVTNPRSLSRASAFVLPLVLLGRGGEARRTASRGSQPWRAGPPRLARACPWLRLKARGLWSSERHRVKTGRRVLVMG